MSLRYDEYIKVYVLYNANMKVGFTISVNDGFSSYSLLYSWINLASEWFLIESRISLFTVSKSDIHLIWFMSYNTYRYIIIY